LLTSHKLFCQNHIDSLAGELRLIKSFKVLDKKTREFNGKYNDFKTQGVIGFGFRFYQNNFQYLRSTCIATSIGKDDEIFSCLIIRYWYDTIKMIATYDTLVNWTDSSFVDIYVSKHNDLFKTSFTRNNFAISECGKFGVGCGVRGSPQPSIVKTCELVNKNDKEKLKQWCTSLSPQDRIHGVIGLYFLKSNGIALTSDEESLIKLNQNSDTLVEFCQGCTEGPFDTMKSLINSKALKYYYNWYKAYGYSRL
jgi:hypothetical protein